MWITIPDAAQRLAVSPDTVRRMISSGDLHAERFGKRLIRINADSLRGTPIGGALG
jgi:excisionase family DNA binding protein